MKTLRRLFILLTVILSMGPISAQSKKPTRRPAKPSTVSAEKKADTSPQTPSMVAPQSAVGDKESAVIVEKLLAQSGHKYTSAGGGVWVIRRNGKSLQYFQVVLYTGPGTLTTEVTVPPIKSAPPLKEMALNLLRLSSRLNYVKIGVDKDDLFVRNEARLKSLNVEEFKDNIEKVAMAADMVYQEMQQFR
jgi:hypothetical protein